MCNSGKEVRNPKNWPKAVLFVDNLWRLEQKKQSTYRDLEQGFKVRHQDDTNSVQIVKK